MCDECSGDFVIDVFDYIRNFGITLENNYPYKRVNSRKYFDLMIKLFKIKEEN